MIASLLFKAVRDETLVKILGNKIAPTIGNALVVREERF